MLLPTLRWHSLAAGLAALVFTAAAQATLRCGSALVALGDSSGEVRRQCGSPSAQRIEEPALRNNGVPKRGAARVEFWVYGPSGGGYQHLRFVDGRLVEIRFSRQP